MSNDNTGPGPGGPGAGGRGKVAALLAVAVVIGALFWAMQAVVQHNALQNCIDSGRRDCGSGAGTP